MYHNQIVHHKPCFNLFILHNKLFDNQGREINKKTIFCTFQHIVFYCQLPPLRFNSRLTVYEPLKSNSQISKFYSNKN